MKPIQPPSLPCALTIAGSDSGGGAGVQADLKTFQAFGVHGLTVITCVTAQNPDRLLAAYALPVSIIRSQLEAVDSFFSPNCIKIGMLFSARVVREVSQFLLPKRGAFVVHDPVMVSTSGQNLLDASTLKILAHDLIPLCSVLTPNIPEAEVLLSHKITSEIGMKKAVKRLFDQFGRPVLLKGGHLSSQKHVLDIYWDGKEEQILKSPRVKELKTHGTGCTYASALCAGVAMGKSVQAALEDAHRYVHHAIKNSQSCHRAMVLNWNFSDLPEKIIKQKLA